MSEWGPIIGWAITIPFTFYGAHCFHKNYVEPWCNGPLKEWLFRMLCRWYGIKP